MNKDQNRVDKHATLLLIVIGALITILFIIALC